MIEGKYFGYEFQGVGHSGGVFLGGLVKACKYFWGGHGLNKLVGFFFGHVCKGQGRLKKMAFSISFIQTTSLSLHPPHPIARDRRIMVTILPATLQL